MTTTARMPSARALATKAVKEGSRRKREEGFAVGASTDGTRGAVPVVDYESVLGLCPVFRVACEEPREAGVGFGGEGVDGKLPSEAPGQQIGVASDKGVLTGLATSAAVLRDRSSMPPRPVESLGAWRNSEWHRASRWRRAKHTAHCWRNVDEEHPFRRAERAVTQSFRMMTQESDRSSSCEATSKARTPPSASRRTWYCMSSESDSAYSSRMARTNGGLADS